MLARRFEYYEEDYALEAERQRQQELQERKAKKEQAECRALRRGLLQLAAVVFCGYMACVALSSWAMYEGNSLVALQKEEKLIGRRNSELNIEVEQLKSPNRIISFAEGQLDMKVARSTIYVNAAAKGTGRRENVLLAGK